MSRTAIAFAIILNAMLGASQELVFCDGFEPGTAIAWSNTPGFYATFDCGVDDFSAIHGNEWYHMSGDGFLALGAGMTASDFYPEYDLWGSEIRSRCVAVSQDAGFTVKAAMKLVESTDTRCYLGTAAYADFDCLTAVSITVSKIEVESTWGVFAFPTSSGSGAQSVRVVIRCSSPGLGGGYFTVAIDDVSVELVAD